MTATTQFITEINSIEWFTEHYPDEKKRYWKISDFLAKSLEEDIIPVGKRELLEFIRYYTIKKTGLDPYEAAMEIDK